MGLPVENTAGIDAQPERDAVRELSLELLRPRLYVLFTPRTSVGSLSVTRLLFLRWQEIAARTVETIEATP